MRQFALLAALILVASGLPAVDAKHLSVGWSDNVGVESEESVENPTVTENDYEVGTSTGCYEPDSGNRTVGEVQKAHASDSFCGELIYHRGTGFENVGEPDQRLNGPIGSFDVVRAGKPLPTQSTCYPWCSSNAAGDTAFRAVHRVGHELGLTDDPDEASKKDGENTQVYTVSPTYPTAASVLQDEGELWRMNGWYHPQPAHETFVAFLTDRDGDPIDDQRLQEIVDANRDQFSKDRPVADTICGFTPNEFALETALLGVYYSPADDGWCQISFEWIEESGGQNDFREGYKDPCRSPTYVCGAAQPGWKATIWCPSWDACTGGGPSSKDVEYSIWHWAVAPTRSVCNGQQTPGMSFDTKAPWTYLAHDLDVWTPVTSLNQEDTEGAGHLHEYATETPEEAQEDADEALTENLTDVFSELNRLLGVVPEGVPDVQKPGRVEPNHAPDDLASMGLTEDSQSKSWPREDSQDGDACSFFSSVLPGKEEYVDPWVNIVDMDTVTKGIPGVFASNSNVALYGNAAEHQDRVNQPTSGPVTFGGMLGVFTDRRDTGDYEPVGDPTIGQGAYPLAWDLRVDEEGNIDPESGCSLGGGQKLVEAMQQAHYGPHTGLVMAVYLEEPTVAHDPSTLESIPFPAGETIFIHESQAMMQLRKLDDPRVTEWLDRIVEGLRSHPDIADEANVVYLNDRFQRDSSFGPGCQGSSYEEFQTSVSLVHQCETGCAGDTIVTGYMIESTHPDHRIGADQGAIPPLEFDSGEVFGLEESIETWLDVDPFDNNPDRNRKNSSAPPH